MAAQVSAITCAEARAWADFFGLRVEQWDWRCEYRLVNYEVCINLDELKDFAACVERPAELCAHEEAATQDEDFDASYEEWLHLALNNDLALALERSCNDQGLLLDSDMRALRLQTVPDESRHALGLFFRSCPRHVRALLAHDLFWMVRIERGRRTGTATLALSFG